VEVSCGGARVKVSPFGVSDVVLSHIISDISESDEFWHIRIRFLTFSCPPIHLNSTDRTRRALSFSRLSPGRKNDNTHQESQSSPTQRYTCLFLHYWNEPLTIQFIIFCEYCMNEIPSCRKFSNCSYFPLLLHQKIQLTIQSTYWDCGLPISTC